MAKLQSFFLSRHVPTKEQVVDMERICKKLGASPPKQLKEWSNRFFQYSQKCYPFMPMGSVLFLVGTDKHCNAAVQAGYIVIRPKMKDRKSFSNHVRFRYSQTLEVII